MASRNEVLLNALLKDIRETLFPNCEEGEANFKEYMMENIGFTEYELKKVYPEIYTPVIPVTVLLKELDSTKNFPVIGTNVIFRLKGDSEIRIGVYDYNEYNNPRWIDINNKDEFESPEISRWSEYKI